MKYIDLLRAHQQTSGDTTEDSPAQDISVTEAALPDEDVLPTTSTCEEHPVLQDLPDEGGDIEEAPTLNATAEVEAATPSNHDETSTHSSDHTETLQWLQQCTRYIETIFESAENKKPFQIKPLEQHIQQLLEYLEHDSEQHFIDALELHIAQQTQHIREQHPQLGGLIQKSILMMLYTIKTGERLHLEADSLKTHTLAAMLHHIGMAQVDVSIRNKKERLTKDELKEIHQAPQRGVEYMKASGIDDEVILDACLQAGERYDGSGYSGLSGSNIAWSARLVGALSMFEALIHYRPYRNRLLPRDAIREMVKHHKKAFDPDILKALIESISLYPIGTYVQLNTGEIGLVTHIHPYRPLRPVVHIRMDHHGHEIPPRDIDLTTQPNLTVERCMYEEATLELAEQSKNSN